jgi:recombinational DNA repair protein (RecF pathway)
MRDNGGVQGYRDDGVVLRTQKLGEADRIITILTRHSGRVRAVARGVRRTKSRFGARLEPFTHVDVMIYPGRTLDVITQAEVIRAYGTPLAADYPKYTAGTAMLETAERFTPVEKEPAIRQFLLLIGGLRALGEAVDPDLAGVADGPAATLPPVVDGPATPPPVVDGPVVDGPVVDGPVVDGPVVDGPATLPPVVDGPVVDESVVKEPVFNYAQSTETRKADASPRDPRMVLDAYFLRSLTFAGYAPALTECARCGAPATSMTGPSAPPGDTKPLVAFAVAAGGMVCADCRPAGSASPAPQTVALMVALLQGDWTQAMRSEHRHRVECSGLVAAYLQWHLEHSIRSLRHVERA